VKVFRVLLATLKEIFEESAYERFCATEALPVCPDSYARFLRTADQTKRPTVRCC